MIPSPFPEVVCRRCDRVFHVAGTVDPDDWTCDDCLDALAEKAIEAELARWHGASTWPFRGEQ